MGLNITIPPVVTKDLPISPRFTPYEFYRDVSSALLQLVNQRLNFTYSHANVIRYGRKNTTSGDKDRTHDFRTTSRCAVYLLDHSGDEIWMMKILKSLFVTVYIRHRSTSRWRLS